MILPRASVRRFKSHRNLSFLHSGPKHLIGGSDSDNNFYLPTCIIQETDGQFEFNLLRGLKGSELRICSRVELCH